MQTTPTEISFDIYLQQRSWPERYRLLMAWGGQSNMLEADMIEANEIKQCSAATWLALKQRSPKPCFSFFSESKLITGIGNMLLRELENLPPNANISEWENQTLTKSEFKKHLSPSRANGIIKMIERAQVLLNE